MFHTVGPLNSAVLVAWLAASSSAHAGVHSCRLNSVLGTDSTAVGHGWVHITHLLRPTCRCATARTTSPNYLENYAFSLPHCSLLDETYSMEWGHPGLGFIRPQSVVDSSSCWHQSFCRMSPKSEVTVWENANKFLKSLVFRKGEEKWESEPESHHQKLPSSFDRYVQS